MYMYVYMWHVRSFLPSMPILTTLWGSPLNVCWSAMPLSSPMSPPRASTSKFVTRMNILPHPLIARDRRSAMFLVPTPRGKWWRERERESERQTGRERERCCVHVHVLMYFYSLERLILKCGLKGPSWLHIKQPSMLHRQVMWQSCDPCNNVCTCVWQYMLSVITFVHVHTCIACPQQPISWCKCEAIVQSMNSISVVAEQPPPPPLVVMSLSVKIILNPKTGSNEVQNKKNYTHIFLRWIVHFSLC